MPQLNFSVFPSQFFWLSISFFTMLFIMSKLIIPRIAEMINLRKEKIDGYLNEASIYKKKSEQALENYHHALKDATAQANLSLQKTKQEMKNLIERKQSELNNELNYLIADNDNKIKKSKEKAEAQTSALTEQLALEVIKKLGFENISEDTVKKVANSITKD